MRSRASAPSIGLRWRRGRRAVASASPIAAPARPAISGLAATISPRRCATPAFACARATREGDTIDGRRSLRTVIAQRPGTIDERIVVVAHRDAAGESAEAELSGTAALLELARIFGAPRQTRRTLTLVSTSGGSGGAAGAADSRAS